MSKSVELKLSIKKFIFQSLLENIVAVVPSKDIVPVLKNFLLVADEKAVRVAATDLELSALSSTQVAIVDVPGSAIFPAKKMLDILREAEDGDLEISVQDGAADIAVGNAAWTLRLQDRQDYPSIPNESSVEFHDVDRVRFLSALQAVRYAAAKDTTRPSLMMIDVSSGQMTACDGLRFQRTQFESDDDVEVQIPISAVPDLIRMLRASEAETVQLGETEYHLFFKIGRDSFIANKMLAQFPDVDELLVRPAENNKHLLSIDRADLSAAVKRVRINADPDTSAIVLGMSPNSLTVSARDRHGNTSSETVSAMWQGGERSVVVNHSFLLDMLSAYDDATCSFWLGDDTKTRKSPVVLRDDDRNTVGIINQMRQDWIL